MDGDKAVVKYTITLMTKKESLIEKLLFIRRLQTIRFNLLLSIMDIIK